MIKKTLLTMAALLLVSGSFSVYAGELSGVTFPDEKVMAGKTLKLNGMAIRKALVFIKVFVGGFYLEHPTTDADEAIESEQVKHFYLQYMTSKATAKKIQEGFIEKMEDCNSPDLVQKHRAEIDQYAAWLDQDMKPGSISESLYVPGKGLTLTVNGVEKGTIEDVEFAQMYYRYSLGDKADKKLRRGYLGL